MTTGVLLLTGENSIIKLRPWLKKGDLQVHLPTVLVLIRECFLSRSLHPATLDNKSQVDVDRVLLISIHTFGITCTSEVSPNTVCLLQRCRCRTQLESHFGPSFYGHITYRSEEQVVLCHSPDFSILLHGTPHLASPSPEPISPPTTSSRFFACLVVEFLHQKISGFLSVSTRHAP